MKEWSCYRYQTFSFQILYKQQAYGLSKNTFWACEVSESVTLPVTTVSTEMLIFPRWAHHIFWPPLITFPFLLFHNFCKLVI